MFRHMLRERMNFGFCTHSFFCQIDPLVLAVNFSGRCCTDLDSHHVSAQFLDGYGSVILVKCNLGLLSWLGIFGNRI